MAEVARVLAVRQQTEASERSSSRVRTMGEISAGTPARHLRHHNRPPVYTITLCLRPGPALWIPRACFHLLGHTQTLETHTHTEQSLPPDISLPSPLKCPSAGLQKAGSCCGLCLYMVNPVFCTKSFENPSARQVTQTFWMKANKGFPLLLLCTPTRPTSPPIWCNLRCFQEGQGFLYGPHDPPKIAAGGLSPEFSLPVWGSESRESRGRTLTARFLSSFCLGLCLLGDLLQPPLRIWPYWPSRGEEKALTFLISSPTHWRPNTGHIPVPQ